MKLRLRGDTLRLRLTRSEVDAVGAAQSVAETLHLPDGSALSYKLVTGPSNNIYMRRESDLAEIVVQVVAAQAHSWASSEQVGYSGETPLQIGAVSVLIEKDFTCITPRAGEEESDTFPNPQAAG
ncbi:MAG: hypothetical protein V2I41_08580 [Pseudomonadales bacterium]|nr:hypothetical protein [Pseudomonadales bacterium]